MWNNRYDFLANFVNLSTLFSFFVFFLVGMFVIISKVQV